MSNPGRMFCTGIGTSLENELRKWADVNARFRAGPESESSSISGSRLATGHSTDPSRESPLVQAALWERRRWYSSDICATDDVAYSTTRSSWNELRSLLQDINALQTAIQDDVTQLGASVLVASRSRGFPSLPDELLIHMFEVLADSFHWLEDWKAMHRIRGNLHLVSKRFHSCASAAPKLSTYDTLDGSDEDLFARLKDRIHDPEHTFPRKYDFSQIKKFIIRDLSYHYPERLGPAFLQTSVRYLDLGHSLDDRCEPPEDALYLRFRLPHLEYVQIRLLDSEERRIFKLSDMERPEVGAYFFVMDMPALKSIHISYTPCDGSKSEPDLADFIGAILGMPLRVYPSVSYLELLKTTEDSIVVLPGAHTERLKTCRVDLSTLLDGLPNLRSLTLHQWPHLHYCVSNTKSSFKKKPNPLLSTVRIVAGEVGRILPRSSIRSSISVAVMVQDLLRRGCPLSEVTICSPAAADDVLLTSVRKVYPHTQRVVPIL